MAKQQKFNTSFLSLLFLTLNILLISCSDTKTSTVLVDNNVIEIRSDKGFFTEIKNLIDSLEKGTLIHYDYSEDSEEEEDSEDDIQEESGKYIEKVTHNKYTMEKDLQELKDLQTKLNKGESTEEELKLAYKRLDIIIKKYNLKDKNGKIEKELQDRNDENDEEDIDEDDQNSIIKSYVGEKLEETNNFNIDTFDEFLKQSVKKLNIMILFTMESNVKVKLAATF